jgi:ribosomal RNA-processing protein 17
VEDEEKGKDGKLVVRRDANGKRIWTKEKPKTEWPKKKKKKFRYESKADRKVTRYKEGAKKRKQKEARSKAAE